MLPTHGRVRENGAQALASLADLLEQAQVRVRRSSDQHASRDPVSLARALFGEDDAPIAAQSEHEICYANFVRSVLDPVRTLPAPRLG